MDLRPGHGGFKQSRKFFSSIRQDLARYVEYAIQYEAPDDSGETRRERNERFGQPSPDPPELEDGAEGLLEAFWSISRLRDQGYNGPLPIKPRDIRDWSEMTGNLLTREEIMVLMEMDVAYLKAWQQEADAAAERRESRRKATSSQTGGSGVPPGM